MVSLEANDRLSNQEAVLGALLIEDKLIGPVLSKVSERDFLDDTYRQIFLAIRAQFVSGRPVDPVTVRDRLGGGEDWSKLLIQIMEDTPTAANIWEYVPRMQEQARVVQGRGIAQELAEARDMEELRRGLDKLQALTVERQDVRRMNMEQMLQSFWQRHTTPHRYMTWGLSKLDEQLFADLGDMVVLGGYPSAGKTALAVSFAYHQSEAKRVGFYSLETSRYKLADRLISNMAGIEMAAIKRGSLTEEEWAQAADAAPKIIKHQLELVDASGMTASDIRADALANRYQIVYVDYLQIVEPETRKANRTEQVSAISRTFQQMAHGNGVLVVALSQLTRSEKTRDESKYIEPTMSDLRESGQIEQDADAILLLYLEDPSKPNESRRVLKLAKNKDGERGRMYLAFDGAYQRFRQSVVDQAAPKVTPFKRPRQYKQVSFADSFWEGIYADDPDDPFRPTEQNQTGGADGQAKPE
ncbi:replicative DNA helicase [Intestinimonas massiliensis (ex Afouda et al. 2020)]|uniref:replicative DNA helicase n=1 Tax=Intestinimonas massiliensis (ex Afouda et al. 2020) TaxID=1673721 RepID=UPI0010322AF2|nr:DnaB-like helicase C-terminal domain-containing protein [Intestinimonas massiliensis (ex Afouda et al. 2020)]